ncbi:hypothetical protein [Dechloromonas sp. A34]|uniref:hypothetical protein n=1 Tax=Dechloromonas sp. A34 TaxID=447588 RepID=UPI00224960E0|nr:hypothetical protein [Dechloromonas sp. A34]
MLVGIPRVFMLEGKRGGDGIVDGRHHCTDGVRLLLQVFAGGACGRALALRSPDAGLLSGTERRIHGGLSVLKIMGLGRSAEKTGSARGPRARKSRPRRSGALHKLCLSNYFSRFGIEQSQRSASEMHDFSDFGY